MTSDEWYVTLTVAGWEYVDCDDECGVSYAFTLYGTDTGSIDRLYAVLEIVYRSGCARIWMIVGAVLRRLYDTVVSSDRYLAVTYVAII